jgi:hypothetical protein
VNQANIGCVLHHRHVFQHTVTDFTNKLFPTFARVPTCLLLNPETSVYNGKARWQRLRDKKDTGTLSNSCGRMHHTSNTGKAWRLLGISPERDIPWAYLALTLLLVVAAVHNILIVIGQLPLFTESGYGDSYIAYDVGQYQRTGVIYRPPSKPPYNPSNYSPLIYMLLSVPQRFFSFANPFLGPRLLVITFFCLSVLVSASLARRLVRHRAAVGLTCMLVVSTQSFGEWICQMRGDFMACTFSLLAIRLLLSKTRFSVIAAGVAAGVAFLFKLTFIAAILAGLMWLCWLRRFWPAVQFGAAAAVVGLGGYELLQYNQPYMLANILTMRTPLIDNKGAAGLTLLAVSEPVFLLGISTMLFRRNLRPGWRLVLLFAALSFLISVITVRQAGGHVNYFFESFLTLAPAASIGMLELRRARHIEGSPSLLLAGIVILMIVVPNLRSTLSVARTLNPGNIREENAKVAALETTLKDMHILSVVPRISLMSREPPLITEPFLLRYLELQHRFDFHPLCTRIEAAEFDLVVTFYGRSNFRGVELLSPALKTAITTAYTPFCQLEDNLIHVPKGKPISQKVQTLVNIGCLPLGDHADKLRWP